jgi:steroid delta-isomerase-like uncharacterized protein
MTTTSEIKDVVRRLYHEGLNGGNLDLADELLTPDFKNNGGFTEEPGPENFKDTIRRMRSAFSDVEYVIEDMVAEGDRVAVRWTMKGKHTGPFMGVEPTGKDVEHRAMVIFRHVDGRIAERWGIVDVMGLLRQLGKVPGPPAGP